MIALTQRALVSSILLTAVACAALYGADPVVAADFTFTPTVSVSEEFNDNILDSATDKKSDFVTRLQPGAAAAYRGPSLNGDLSYNFDYQNYARRTKDDEENHYLASRGSAELLKNFFFLDVSDTLSRVSLDVARDVTAESPYANQTDRNRANVSPYLLWRLGETSTLKTGYRFIDTSFWGSPGIDRREHVGFAELSHNPAARLSLSGGYTFASISTDVVDYDQHDLSAGFRYEYADKSFLYGGIGNSWQEFTDSRSASNLFWHAGVNRDFGFLMATLETRVQYTDDPLAVSTEETTYRVSMEKALHKGAIGLSSSYTEYQDTLTDGSERRKGEVRGFWRAELSQGLITSLVLIGDRVSQKTLMDYPYHFSGSAGLSYLFNYDITGSLNYSYIDYRRELDSAADSRQTNRVILALKKIF